MKAVIDVQRLIDRNAHLVLIDWSDGSLLRRMVIPDEPPKAFLRIVEGQIRDGTAAGELRWKALRDTLRKESVILELSRAFRTGSLPLALGAPPA